MDIFDLKNNYELMNQNLTNIIKSLKENLEDKNRSLELSNEKNNSLQQSIKNLESINKNIQERLKKLENDYEGSLRKWKMKKIKLQKEVVSHENLIKNNLPFEEFKEAENNSQNLNLYDYELHVKLTLSRKINLTRFLIF
jgi:light-regulated signal transduction histidine kinase (bacteriophytochrome)